MNVLFLNGSRCEKLCAVSFYNPTFLYGISCFEGVRAYWHGSAQQLVFLDLMEHLRRLYRSAEYMSFSAPVTIDRLHAEVKRIAEHEHVQEDAYLRITFFLGGDGSWHSVNDVHYMISFRSMRSELGVRAPATLGLTRYRRIASDAMPAYVKAGANYLNSRYAMLDVRSRGFNDALFLTSDGMVAEATGSTIFFFRKGEILTPSLDCGILPGVTRARIIRLCAENGLPVTELKIPEADLFSFDGAILTGTMVEIRPVSRLEAWHYNPESALHGKLIELLRDYVFRRKAEETAG